MNEGGVYRTSLVAQMVKCLPTVQENRVQSVSREDLLEKEMVTHSSILAWKIPWAEEPGRLQSMGLQRVGHDWATSLSLSRVRSSWGGGAAHYKAAPVIRASDQMVNRTFIHPGWVSKDALPSPVSHHTGLSPSLFQLLWSKTLFLFGISSSTPNHKLFLGHVGYISCQSI